MSPRRVEWRIRLRQRHSLTADVRDGLLRRVSIVGWWVAIADPPGNEAWVLAACGEPAPRAAFGRLAVGVSAAIQRLVLPTATGMTLRLVGKRWAVSRDQIAEPSVTAPKFSSLNPANLAEPAASAAARRQRRCVRANHLERRARSTACVVGPPDAALHAERRRGESVHVNASSRQ